MTQCTLVRSLRFTDYDCRKAGCFLDAAFYYSLAGSIPDAIDPSMKDAARTYAAGMLSLEAALEDMHRENGKLWFRSRIGRTAESLGTLDTAVTEARQIVYDAESRYVSLVDYFYALERAATSLYDAIAAHTGIGSEAAKMHMVRRLQAEELDYMLENKEVDADWRLDGRKVYNPVVEGMRYEAVINPRLVEIARNLHHSNMDELADALPGNLSRLKMMMG